jgi:ubiquinone/menaquinone biosynthesis C-methylase UbiE
VARAGRGGAIGGRGLAIAVLVAACSPSRPPEPEPTEEDRARYDRQRRPDELVAALAIPEGATVADVGAGTGYLTGRLAAAVGPAGRVVATDIDADALAKLEARVKDARVTTRRVTPDDPGLEAGAYDRVLLAQVDHLLADRAAYFRKLAAALAPGGRLAVANRLPYRQRVVDAASAAGLRAVSEHGLPGQFLIQFEVTP